MYKGGRKEAVSLRGGVVLMTARTIAAAKKLGVIGDAVAVVIVLDRRADGLLGQHGAVQLVRGQTVERFGDRLIRQRQRLGHGLTLDHLRRH